MFSGSRRPRGFAVAYWLVLTLASAYSLDIGPNPYQSAPSFWLFDVGLLVCLLLVWGRSDRGDRPNAVRGAIFCSLCAIGAYFKMELAWPLPLYHSIGAPALSTVSGLLWVAFPVCAWTSLGKGHVRAHD